MGYGFRWKCAFDGERLPLDPSEDYDLGKARDARAP
jgi:hypothetical protein